MIRGLSQLNCPPKLRVPLLAALLAVALGISKTTASPMEAEAFADEVSGTALEVMTAPFPATATLTRDGAVELQSAIGTFHGAWVGQGTSFCLIFESGPVAGQNCVKIEERADGTFATSEGTELRPVASAYRF
ncbi:MAG: hypothetical protein AAFR53_06065 [Pseudomonadota bacterium]